MNKVLSLLLAISMLFCLAACGGPTTPTDEISATNSTDEVTTTTTAPSGVSDAVITEAMLSFRYPSNGFSIPLRDLLPQCCPDYKGTFAPYEQLKNERLDEETIKKYEESNIKQYLGNAYFVTLTGCIMENPEIPYLVSENKEILTLLILFDENDSVVGHIVVENCSELDTCALLIVANSF